MNLCASLRRVSFLQQIICVVFLCMAVLPLIVDAQVLRSDANPTPTAQTPLYTVPAVQSGPTNYVEASSANPASPTPAPAGTDTKPNQNSNQTKSVWDCVQNSFATCLASLGLGVYETVFLPVGAAIFRMSGLIMDLAFETSIRTDFYFTSDGVNDNQAIVTVWNVMRDLLNLFVVFLFIYNGIMVMFGRGDKRYIITVIIFAVSVNFSLFFAKLVLDAGHITALWFKRGVQNTIETTLKNNAGSGLAQSGQTPSISGFFMWRLGVPEFWNPASYKDYFQSRLDASTTSGGLETLYQIPMLVLQTILKTIVLVSGTAMFLYIAFLFIARIPFVFIALMTSPLYVPMIFGGNIFSLKGVEKVSKNFDEFKDMLMSQATWPVVFFLMLFVVTQILGSELFSTGALSGNTGSFVQILRYFIVLMLMKKLVDESKTYAGVANDLIEGAAKKAISLATSVALGVATGGAAAVARGTFGAAGNKLAMSEGVKNLQNSKNFAGRALGNVLYGAGDKARKSSFDLRNNDSYKSLAKDSAGFDIKEASLGLETKDKYQGYLGAQEKFKDETKKAAQEAAKSMTDLQFKTLSDLKYEDMLIQNFLSRKGDFKEGSDEAKAIKELENQNQHAKDAKAYRGEYSNLDADALSGKNNAELELLAKKIRDNPGMFDEFEDEYRTITGFVEDRKAGKDPNTSILKGVALAFKNPKRWDDAAKENDKKGDEARDKVLAYSKRQSVDKQFEALRDKVASKEKLELENTQKEIEAATKLLDEAEAAGVADDGSYHGIAMKELKSELKALTEKRNANVAKIREEEKKTLEAIRAADRVEQTGQYYETGALKAVAQVATGGLRKVGTVGGGVMTPEYKAALSSFEKKMDTVQALATGGVSADNRKKAVAEARKESKFKMKAQERKDKKSGEKKEKKDDDKKDGGKKDEEKKGGDKK